MFKRRRKQQSKSDSVVIRGLVMPKGTNVKLGTIPTKRFVGLKRNSRTQPSQVGNANG